MADAIKVLGQVDAAATTITPLYTVPNLAQTTTSSLVICNRSAGAITYRVSVHVNNAGANNKQFLYYDKTLASKETFAAVLGMTLGQNDVVKVYASAIDMSFTLFGVETS